MAKCLVHHIDAIEYLVLRFYILSIYRCSYRSFVDFLCSVFLFEIRRYGPMMWT